MKRDFILHISRLADIENHNVVPSLHKLYSLAVIYHLNPMEITDWYETPFPINHSGWRTVLAAENPFEQFSLPLVQPIKQESSFDQQKTHLLNRLPPGTERFPGLEREVTGRLRYGYIGLSDRRMMPILRPGSMVLVDTSLRQLDLDDWSSEYARPLYFVELREGYRCGWFQRDKSRLIMHPHALSHCAPESWRTPDEAEIVGRVVGMVTYLNEPWACSPAAIRTEHADLIRKAL